VASIWALPRQASCGEIEKSKNERALQGVPGFVAIVGDGERVVMSAG
jgi:hypothetical protein